MNKFWVILTFCSCGVMASAKVHAPLPSGAYTAKTIAILNHTGTQSVTDRAYEELQKWGRFSVLSDPAKADIVLVIGESQRSVGATSQTYGYNTYTTVNRVDDITISFFLNSQPEPFFSETERVSIFRKSATKRCVDDFRKRIEKSEKP